MEKFQWQASEIRCRDLAILKKQLTFAKSREITTMRLTERRAAAGHRDMLRAKHKTEIEKLCSDVQHLNDEISALKTEILQRKSREQELSEALREVITEFQRFLDQSSDFTPGQTDYLLPLKHMTLLNASQSN